MKNYTEEELAKIAISNRLYVNGWQMRLEYEYIIHGEKDIGIDILFIDNIPVATCIIKLKDDFINVFVRKKYRKKQYGQKIVAQTLKKYNKGINEVYGSLGTEASEKFYNSCGIAYFKNNFSISLEERIELVNKQISMKTIREKRIKKYLEKNKLIEIGKNFEKLNKITASNL